ncbi:hypothetical protein ACJMK2_011454 [Sinanodonta woodiana]|uniref:Transmembrane protein n=1 Tax=Sinanodonta woodiana TaxID=1069815 RepID=A0ABD3V526_SINWO
MGSGKGGAEKSAVCGMCGVLLLIFLLIVIICGLGLAKLIIGAVYIENCSSQPKLPVWLIVNACIPTFLSGLSFIFKNYTKGKNRKKSRSSAENVIRIISITSFLFNFAWVIVGSYWVSTVWSRVKYDSCNTCCSGILTDFALSMVIMDWLWLIVFFVLIISSMFVAANSSTTIGQNQDSVFFIKIERTQVP